MSLSTCLCVLPPAAPQQGPPTRRPHTHTCPLPIRSCTLSRTSFISHTGGTFLYEGLHTRSSLYFGLSPKKAVLPTTRPGPFTFMWVINVSLVIPKGHRHIDIRRYNWSIPLSWRSGSSRGFLSCNLMPSRSENALCTISVLFHPFVETCSMAQHIVYGGDCITGAWKECPL